MIDYETLMNDKKLLIEERDQWKKEYMDLRQAHEYVMKELNAVLDQRSMLTDEVMRLSAIVEGKYVDDGK